MLPEKVDLSYCLSEFQLEVLDDICDGLRPQAIAKKRYKSIGAINHAIQCLYAKLDCKNAIELFKVSYGFLPAPEEIKNPGNESGVKAIIRLHLQGLKAAQISQRTGNSRNYVYNVVNAYKAVQKASRTLEEMIEDEQS